MPKADAAVRDRGIVGQMLKYCLQIEESLGEIDRSQERFMASHTYQNAVAMCILRTGELSKQLSEEFKSAHIHIPWALMARTRDIYAHRYGSMDFALVWATAVGDIPLIKAFCEEFLAQ